MIREEVVIEYKKLHAHMTVIEDDVIVSYSIDVYADRSHATVRRTVFEFADWGVDEIGKAIRNEETEMTLDQIKSSQVYSDMFVWLARGLWGIPVRYASEKT